VNIDKSTKLIGAFGLSSQKILDKRVPLDSQTLNIPLVKGWNDFQ
jgi:hypothetical protein